MPEFFLKVLGANSATPMPGRFPSSFVLQYDQDLILLDCGEGSQIKMSQFQIKRSKIDHIFISHLHGDHVLGLPGLLNSFSLNNRNHPLQITGPAGISDFVRNVISATGARTSFELNFQELISNQVHSLGHICKLKAVAFPLKHRLATFGYRFDEVPGPSNIDPLAIRKYKLTVEEIKSIKAGATLLRDQMVIPKDKLTLPPRKLRSFAYCTDTIFDPEIIPHIKDINLLYHEATYTHDLAEKARDRMHSTAKEAAIIAQMAGAKKLVIGHYSGRYKDLKPLLTEARSIHLNSYLAEEGLSIQIE